MGFFFINIKKYTINKILKKKYVSKYSLPSSKNIDLLQIDGEGYDDQVIYKSSINFLDQSILILSLKI